MLLLKDPCGAVGMSLVGHGKVRPRGCGTPGTGAGSALCGAVPGAQNPLEDLCVPRAVSHARQPEKDKWSGILSWSYLCVYVLRRSRVISYLSLLKKQLTSKLHYRGALLTQYKGLNSSSPGSRPLLQPSADPAEGRDAVTHGHCSTLAQVNL